MKSYRKELWFEVPTRRAFINITPQVEKCLRESGIKEGFEEAISAHMAGLSWKLGRRIEWDPQGEKVIPVEGGEDLNAVLLDSPPGVGALAPDVVAAL